jgi:hypothetical protein
MEEPSGAPQRMLRGGIDARVEGLIKKVAAKDRSGAEQHQ